MLLNLERGDSAWFDCVLGVGGKVLNSFYCSTLKRVFTSFATVPFIEYEDNVSDIQT